MTNIFLDKYNLQLYCIVHIFTIVTYVSIICLNSFYILRSSIHSPPPLFLPVVLIHVSLSASVFFSSTPSSFPSSSLSFCNFSSRSSSCSSYHSPSLPYLSSSFSPISYCASSLSWSFPSLVLVLIIISLSLSLSYPVVLPHVQSVWSY